MPKHYIEKDSEGFIQGCWAIGDDEDIPDGEQYMQVAERVSWASPPSKTCERVIVGDEIVWQETAPLAALVEVAITKTYIDVDRVHTAAVGSRATEYQEAEAAARAYAAAGYQGTADIDVHSFALHNPTGQVQTDQWAAEQIIARADAFRGAQKAMRNLRFQRQSEMRAATTVDELQAVEALWSQFITNLRAQLGLPPV